MRGNRNLLDTIAALQTESLESRSDDAMREEGLYSQASALQAENARLREALVDAAIPLEVLGGQMNVGNSSGLSPELQEQIFKSVLAIRQALAGHEAGQPVGSPKVLTKADIDKIAANSDPSAIYDCTCGLSPHHQHTQECKAKDAARIAAHRAEPSKGPGGTK